jgi:hypothetical protein
MSERERERALRPLWNHETIGYAKFGLMEFATFSMGAVPACSHSHSITLRLTSA